MLVFFLGVFTQPAVVGAVTHGTNFSDTAAATVVTETEVGWASTTGWSAAAGGAMTLVTRVIDLKTGNTVGTGTESATLAGPGASGNTQSKHRKWYDSK